MVVEIARRAPGGGAWATIRSNIGKPLILNRLNDKILQIIRDRPAHCAAEYQNQT